MYTFIARYQNMDTGKETRRIIEVERQYYKNAKYCYMYAISEAYDMKKENECLGAVELIQR